MTSLKFALPVVAAAIIGAAFALPEPDATTRKPNSVTVTQTSYACPAPASVATGRLAAHADASATAVGLPGESPIDELTPVDSWNTAKADADAVLVNTSDAKGAGAVGFFGGLAAGKDGGGFVVGSCPGVVQDSWYVGAGSGGKHFSTMTLTNLAASPAVADVTLWGEEGSVESVNGEGIVLQAFESKRIALDDLAAGEPALAFRLNSRRGALSVSVRDESTAVFRGTEPLPPTSPPARRQVIAGIAGGASGRQLVAVNPGNATARVKVEALGKDGAFVPTGLDDVKVPAGRVKTVDLPKSVGGKALGLRLTADRPLSAVVRMAPTNKDFAYAVAGEPLSGTAIAPLAIGDVLKEARLLLTAPGAAAKVKVTAFDAEMTARGSIDVDVKARSTLSSDLGKKGLFDEPLGDLAYLVVTPTGAVQGSTYYTRGDGVSAVPLEAAPLKALAPDVRPAR